MQNRKRKLDTAAINTEEAQAPIFSETAQPIQAVKVNDSSEKNQPCGVFDSLENELGINNEPVPNTEDLIQEFFKKIEQLKFDSPQFNENFIFLLIEVRMLELDLKSADEYYVQLSLKNKLINYYDKLKKAIEVRMVLPELPIEIWVVLNSLDIAIIKRKRDILASEPGLGQQEMFKQMYFDQQKARETTLTTSSSNTNNSLIQTNTSTDINKTTSDLNSIQDISEILYLLDEEIESLRQKIANLKITKNKKDFEKIFNSDANIMKLLRGAEIINQNLSTELFYNDVFIQLFKQALQLEVNSDILYAWLHNNKSLMAVLSKRGTNKEFDTTLYQYIWEFTKRTMLESDKKFLQYLIQNVDNSEVLHRVITVLDEAKIVFALSPEDVIRIATIRSLIANTVSKDNQALIDNRQSSTSQTNSQSNLQRNDNEFVMGDKPPVVQSTQASLLPRLMTTPIHSGTVPFSNTFLSNVDVAPICDAELDNDKYKKNIQLLRLTDDSSEFEKIWDDNPQLLQILKNKKIYGTYASFHAIGISVCFEIFFKMLQLKVKSSIVQDVLTNNPQLIARLNENDALKQHFVVDYILSKTPSEQTQLATLFIDSIDSLYVLNGLVSKFKAAENQNKYVPDKLKEIYHIKDLLDNKIKNIEAKFTSSI